MKNISFIRLTFILLGFGLVVASCQKDSDVTPTIPGTDPGISEQVTFQSNDSEESDRLTMLNEVVVLADTSLGRDHCTNYSAWNKVADASTFYYDGQAMSATHVSQVGDIVAVSYHLRGSDYFGIVEVWDVSNPNSLKWKGAVSFEQADINSIVMEAVPTGTSRRLWLALADKKKGAMVAELKLKSNNKFEEDYVRLTQLTKAIPEEASASANAIAERGEHIFVTAGKSKGGAFVLDKESLEVVSSESFSNAKGIALGSYNKVAAIQTDGPGGVYSNLNNLNAAPAELSRFYDTGAIAHQNVEDAENGKVSAAFSTREPNFLFVASGDQGVKGYNLSTSQEVYTSHEAFLRYGNANGIAFDNDYMYVALGADGIAICSMSGALPDETSVFLWDMDEPDASANFISTGNGWVAIAKGEGGFKLLKKATPGDKLATCSTSDDLGTPACLANDVTVCSTLLDRLEAQLPLDSDVESDQPYTLYDGIGEISLIEDTQLKMTFVEENTDLQNSVGYYFYDAECPPASVEELVGMVTFVNYSEVNSEGNLQKGNTVKLPGTFKAGTRVGFFLVRNGFNGSNEIYYSRADFNPDNRPHCMLFADEECGDLIGTLQSNLMPSTDADFRDGTFKITASNPDAIDADDYMRL